MPQAVEFLRLTAHDTPEIGDLLNRVWPAQYGETGCPVFSDDLLAWLYGGPDADEHLLCGCRADGRLVGFKANLFRSGMFQGRPVRSHITTQLAIDTTADMATRIETARHLSTLPTLAEGADDGRPRGAVCLTFFDDTKALVRSTRSIHAAQGIRTTTRPFQQAVVDRFTLRSRPVPEDVALRPATAADGGVLHALLCGHQLGGFLWRPSVDAMAHHLLGAPDARVWIAERNGAPVGFLAGYALEWEKKGRRSRMFVAETMVAAGDPVAVALLKAASDHAAAEGMRGVVVENPLHLGLDDPAACGVIVTPRRMRAVARSRGACEGFFDSFLCDIK